MAKTHAGTTKTSKKTASPRETAVRAALRRTAADPASARRVAPAKRASRSGKLPRVITGAVAAARDKKAEDVVVLDLRNADGFTDYFIICTGGNTRQIAAIADSVREKLKQEYDERPTLTEGLDRSEWILLDYFNFVVHVFSRDCRSFYGLERLWGNAERVDIGEEPHGPE
jgi:ribosome-associated protein